MKKMKTKMKTLISTRLAGRFMTGLALAALVGSPTLLVGCGGGNTPAEEQAEAAAGNKAPTRTSTTLPAGTDLLATLQTEIASDKNHVGDRVQLRTTEAVSVSGRTIVPADATINGTVTHIDPAGSIAGGAEITIRFEELVVAGETYPISCDPFRLWVTGDAQESVLEIGGGAIAGSIIGGILGGQKGAIQGAAIGGAAGAGVAIITPGDQIVLQKGLLMKVTLVSPVAIQR